MMNDLQTSLDKGQEYFLPVADSKSLKALKPDPYLAHVDREMDEFKSSENCPFTETGLMCPIDLPASGIDWR
jgi:hypothetical protein